MRLMGNVRKMPSLAGFDLEVVEFVPPGGERKLRAI
jgi:hypothetical protein